MKKDKHIILGVHITDRLTKVSTVQGLLTEYGGQIKTRLGLHEVEDGFNSPNGVLLLEMIGDEGRSLELADKLNVVEGVEVQKMIFDHD